MKKQILLILLAVGISFAVSAKDFPCISKPDALGKCWTLVKDPRDGQEYLAVKFCGAYNPDSPRDTCTVSFVENSRYKSPNAECGKGKDFFYGCLYTRQEEKLACPDLGSWQMCSFYLGVTPTYTVTGEEYAKLRKEILNKKDKEVMEVFFYRKGDNVAAMSGSRAWVNVDGKWGETTIVKKNVYCACRFWMPGE